MVEGSDGLVKLVITQSTVNVRTVKADAVPKSGVYCAVTVYVFPVNATSVGASVIVYVPASQVTQPGREVDPVPSSMVKSLAAAYVPAVEQVPPFS